MNQQTIIQTEISFKDYLFKDRRNRRILWVAAVSIVIQFAIFKYLYPYASYIHGDSFAYLDAADKNLTINTYMIGYSKFLRLFSVFAKPDIVLVSFQYLLIQSSALILLFTIFYFYRVGKGFQTVLFCFMVFNPLFLHLANMVSSDGFFLALSLLWFSSILWIIHKPSNKIIIWHAIVMFIAFTVRYNAMIYPVIAAIAFWLSDLTLRKKVIGLGSGLLLCCWFIGLTMYQYKKLTGYWQYSPFSGWQMANNAMYAYRYVDSADRKPVPKKFKALDNMVRRFYDRTRNLTIYPSEREQASTFYMWSQGMPLMVYRDSLFRAKDSNAIELKKWASMGPLYKDYGIYIIKQYPLFFAKYFLWPNSRKYYAPPVEFLEKYNSGYKTVSDQTKKWFGYKSTSVNTRMKNNKTWILDIYPILSGVINLVMLFGIIYFLVLKGWQFNIVFKKMLLIGGTIWLLNAVFTISASSAALRFQSFPLILTTTFALLLIDWMVQLMKNMKQVEDNKLEEKFTSEVVA